MEKLVRITCTQQDNPNGELVCVETCVDGENWDLSCAARVTQGVGHPWNPDDVPNEYIHMDIVRRVNKLVSKGFRLVA